MANVNYDFQKRERERAKLAKKAAKARDKANVEERPVSDTAIDPDSGDKPAEDQN